MAKQQFEKRKSKQRSVDTTIKLPPDYATTHPNFRISVHRQSWISEKNEDGHLEWFPKIGIHYLRPGLDGVGQVRGRIEPSALFANLMTRGKIVVHPNDSRLARSLPRDPNDPSDVDGNYIAELETTDPRKFAYCPIWVCPAVGIGGTISFSDMDIELRREVMRDLRDNVLEMSGPDETLLKSWLNDAEDNLRKIEREESSFVDGSIAFSKRVMQTEKVKFLSDALDQIASTFVPRKIVKRKSKVIEPEQS